MPSPAIDLVIEHNSVENVNGVPVGYVSFATDNAVDVPDDAWFIVEQLGGRVFLLAVASVADFTNLPNTPPGEDDSYTIYRANAASFYSDQPAQIKEAIENTRRRFQATIDALKLIAENASGTVISFS